ncbi:hypothetical protein, partial [Herbaspirillum sp.]|uniref:hypothetical protein n=1 Tax=Herbaspirillum sp. TaxID=1890675 RepID=UPI00258C1E15
MSAPPTPKKLLEKAVKFKRKKKPFRSKLDASRGVIIYLKSHNYKLSEIADFLKENQIKITAGSISNYLRKYPATENEIKELERETSAIENGIEKNKYHHETDSKHKDLK